MITAAHILQSQINTVTFDSSTFHSRDMSFTPVQIGSTDLRIFKLSSTPTVGAAQLYDGSAELLNDASLVGAVRNAVDGLADDATLEDVVRDARCLSHVNKLYQFVTRYMSFDRDRRAASVGGPMLPVGRYATSRRSLSRAPMPPTMLPPVLRTPVAAAPCSPAACSSRSSGSRAPSARSRPASA